MAEESDLEKTESASPRKIEKAREAGDIPRSRELATFSILAAATAGFWMVGQSLFIHLRQHMRESLSFKSAPQLDPEQLIINYAKMMFDLVVTFAPFIGIVMITALVTPMLIGGWSFTAGNLAPKFSKLNPMSGLAKIISINSLVELIKAIAKVIFICFAAWYLIESHLIEVMSLMSMPIEIGGAHQMELILLSLSVLVGTLAVITMIDVPYQLWSYNKKLKMTKQEVKDEAKESEGNPEIKAKIRQQQREMARRRMMTKVPTADVVITNPTHYAVALQYPENSNRAPIVVAKGVDDIAMIIRELATEHQVMIVEAPPLARALYTITDLDEEIPPTLYNAVAQILAYVFQLRMSKDAGEAVPDFPKLLDLPTGLDPYDAIKPEATMTETA
ncbi:flagellar biosynthesis protein FlhB [Polynucleobacter sp. SHI8]|uniref:flagellar biosynthesis protein FlhB n=1 Tax=unclassified Polynucleobacter TaxID=2640945 RepID=UPI0024920767|nr:MULTISPECIES: flagellar biosynthesis protein FlhB [unclassified Polynucleobacter]BDW11782.1 flagellar biosynthesis protein FlhB [Polynucleobacter sp. SHI2]BDW14229.1 flagellar biosynthesis protein FlhB [Polynucleobacter sp. SHI8]